MLEETLQLILGYFLNLPLEERTFWYLNHWLQQEAIKLSYNLALQDKISGLNNTAGALLLN